MPKKNKRTKRKKSVAKSTVKRKSRRIKAVSKSVARKKKFSPKRKRVTSTGLVVGTVAVPSVGGREHRDGQSGDLPGLSNRPTVDSESVEELLGQGNDLEAEAIHGLENALDADQGDLQTHEVPEDDVPEEYP